MQKGTTTQWKIVCESGCCNTIFFPDEIFFGGYNIKYVNHKKFVVEIFLLVAVTHNRSKAFILLNFAEKKISIHHVNDLTYLFIYIQNYTNNESIQKKKKQKKIIFYNLQTNTDHPLHYLVES